MKPTADGALFPAMIPAVGVAVLVAGAVTIGLATVDGVALYTALW